MRGLFLFAVLSAVVLFLSCDDPSSSKPSPVVASEEWTIIDESDNAGEADIELNRHENGRISCTGNWYYEFYGSTITCEIMRGRVQKDSTSLDISCSGTASYPPDSSGYVESSGFSLTMSGEFDGSVASGTWDISFTDSEWDEWAPDGEFSGYLENGNGVTE